jgi:hypothetical protein
VSDKKVYKTVAGFVQFDPNVRDHNGREIVDVLIQNLANQQNVRVTVWPEAELTVEKGDFIAANGEFTTRDKDGVTYYNLSAINDRIFVIKANVPGERVVNALDSEPEAATEEEPIF